jgi:hypothetical protein
MNSLFSFLPRLWSNWITLLGAILTTCSGLAIVLVFGIGLVGGANPYTGAFLVIALPIFFVGGLLIIPLGLYLERRKRAKAGISTEPNLAPQAFRTAFGQSGARRLVVFFAAATAVNLIVFSIGGQAAVHHMDSAKFCGTTCHTVMQPEWTSYSDSKHARVACVQCHIGPGASWALKAKLDGLKRVWAVMTRTYHRPIPVPVEDLRPSRDTCEQCHWPEKYTGDKIVVFPHFKPDQANTPAYNVLVVRVGGRNPRTRKYEGIHWHASDKVEVRYEQLDGARNKIGKISVLDQGKLVSEYQPQERDRGLPVVSVRTMDCVDCHDRPAHVFDPSSGAAIDRAMANGGLDPKTPWLVQLATEVLQLKDVPPAEVAGRLRAALEEKYRTSHPEVKLAPEALDAAAATLADLYRHNVYPAMRIEWGTYRNRLGHKHEGDTGDEIGCFRCHDGEHEKTLPGSAKQALAQSCEQCHDQVVAGEDPATLGAEMRQLLPR